MTLSNGPGDTALKRARLHNCDFSVAHIPLHTKQDVIREKGNCLSAPWGSPGREAQLWGPGLHRLKAKPLMLQGVCGGVGCKGLNVMGGSPQPSPHSHSIHSGMFQQKSTSCENEYPFHCVLGFFLATP